MSFRSQPFKILPILKFYKFRFRQCAMRALGIAVKSPQPLE
jgi:hypothetical protein